MIKLKQRPLLLALLLASALGLAACNNEPSDADISEAVLRQVNAQSTTLEQWLGKEIGKEITRAARTFSGEVKGARKIGCQPDGDQAFVCDVELEVEHLGTLRREPARYRFVKGSEGWMVAR
jgi:hypothetical protein